MKPYERYKDSGVEWIGEVPEHWEIAPLKFVAEIQTGLTLGNKYDGLETVERPYLRVANVQDGFLDLDTITTILVPKRSTVRYELQAGDVLMTEGGDFDKLGRGYVWEDQIKGCLHQNHVFAVRPNQSKLYPYYLAFLTSSYHGKNYFTSTSQKTTNLATINRTKLGQFLLILPTANEQKEIIEFLEQKTSQIDTTISKAERQIGLLREYRTALISEVVTGKVDVRGERVGSAVSGSREVAV